MASKQARHDDNVDRRKTDKRKKVETESLGSPIDPRLFEAKTLDKLKEAYRVSFPYPHVRVDGLCLDDRARALQVETKTTLKADFKETDIFKVYQTPDLANLASPSGASDEEVPEDGLGTTTAMSTKWHAPHLVALRDAIYSEKFRAFVSELAGCGPLEPKADCSCNAYVEGGHLLCHDDVINTRRISYIIYLTDPDDPWTVEDGGALELYPVKSIGQPETTPIKNLIPAFNSMVFFTVVPGESFHAVQEVTATGKPRLSISGWYHGKEPPPGMEHATRAQLGVNADATNAIVDWVTLAPQSLAHKAAEQEEDEEDEEDDDLKPIELSKEDVEYLSKWINPQYLDFTILEQLRDRFLDPENGSAVQLDEFLLPEISNNIRRVTLKDDASEGLGVIHKQNKKSNDDPPSFVAYDSGVKDGWRAVGPVHKQRYLLFQKGSANNDAGADNGNHNQEFEHPLYDVQSHVIDSPAFHNWLNQVTCFKPLKSRSLTRRFRPGLDYTVAHVGTLAAAGGSGGSQCVLDATLCFVNDGSDLPDEEEGGKKGKNKKKVGGIGKANKMKAKKNTKSELWHMWDSGEVGGFECYVEAEGADEGGGEQGAPEVYDSRSALEYGEGSSSSSSSTKAKKANKTQQNSEGEEEEEEEAEYDSEDEEEAGGTLLSVQARSNTLSLVTRDEGVMRFVKYVSAFAPGSRWDVSAEYQVE